MYTTIDRVSGNHRDRDGSVWGVYEADLMDDGLHGNPVRLLERCGYGDAGHCAAINRALDLGDYLPPYDFT